MEFLFEELKACFGKLLGEVGFDHCPGGVGLEEEHEGVDAGNEEGIGRLVEIDEGKNAAGFKDAIDFLENLAELAGGHFVEGGAGVDEIELSIGDRHFFGGTDDVICLGDVLFGAFDGEGGNIESGHLVGIAGEELSCLSCAAAEVEDFDGLMIGQAGNAVEGKVTKAGFAANGHGCQAGNGVIDPLVTVTEGAEEGCHGDRPWGVDREQSQ